MYDTNRILQNMANDKISDIKDMLRPNISKILVFSAINNFIWKKQNDTYVICGIQQFW